jgi:hypothetical protein
VAVSAVPNKAPRCIARIPPRCMRLPQIYDTMQATFPEAGSAMENPYSLKAIRAERADRTGSVGLQAEAKL